MKIEVRIVGGRQGAEIATQSARDRVTVLSVSNQIPEAHLDETGSDGFPRPKRVADLADQDREGCRPSRD